MCDRVFRFLGSIKLAIPLLTMITAVLVWATFYEAQVGSTVVSKEIYRSHWFGALMFFLALNLGVSALSRYPWRGARKIGFALTHLGLIVIIAGSAAVIHLGVEGMLLVRTDSAANNQVRVEGELLEVLTAQGLQQADVFVRADGSVSPASFAGLSLLDYSENTVETVSFTEGAKIENPAVRLSLKSDRMGQTLERWLAVAPVAYSKVSVGPAALEILQTDQTQLKQLLAPPLVNQHRWGTLSISAHGTSTEIDVEENLSQSVQISDDVRIIVSNFWADFRLDANNRHTSASAQLNNPAVQVEVVTTEGSDRWFVFSNGFPPIRKSSGHADIEISYAVPPQQPDAYFQVLVSPTGELFYAAKSSQGFQSGALRVGESVSPGWADFQITLEEMVSHAQVQRQVVPVADSRFEGVPALQVRTTEGIQAWLPWGNPTAINTPLEETFAAFGPKLLPLPFAVKLEDFIVERNEGSESVAMWTSQIRIEDHGDVVARRNVWMNHPTWYQGWKIAQASWNPGDLHQSTLQVKREPLWVTALTWSGSALVVLGIATMFYGRAIAKQWQRSSPEVPSEALATEAIAPFSNA